MKRKLVIFDIDGTLTRTNRVDGECYVRAVRECIQPNFEAFEPEAYRHFTDSNIVLELFELHRGKSPSPREQALFKQLYLKHLCGAFHLQPQAFAPVPGSEELLHALPPEWQPALATGCWQESAWLKLAFAGVAAEGLPAGTASDAISRADILLKAIERSRPFLAQGLGDWERIVYVGDGIWDVRTCAQLGLPLIGIDAENDPDKRRALGRHWLLTDYNDRSRFCELLETV